VDRKERGNDRKCDSIGNRGNHPISTGTGWGVARNVEIQQLELLDNQELKTLVLAIVV